MMKKKKIIVIAALVLLIVVIAIAVCFMANSNQRKLDRQLDLGQQYMDELDYEEALASYLMAIEIDDKCDAAYIGAAKAYVKLDQMEAAVDILKQGYEKSESNEIKNLLDSLEKELSQKMEAKTTSDTSKKDVNSDKNDGEENQTDDSANEKNNENDVYSGEYDAEQLEYFIDTEWFIYQVINDEYIALMYPAKGDLPVLFLDSKGNVIYEGLTDSDYGETYITEYNGNLAIIDYRTDDPESGIYTRSILDMNGNILEEENFESEYLWYDEGYDEFPLVGLNIESENSNQEITVENTEDGVFVYDSQGNQVACYQDANGDGTEISQNWQQEYPIYGEIRGNYLIITQIVAGNETSYEHEQNYIYKIK